MIRRVIRIRAEDSPNVRARRRVYPGVLTWEEYRHRREHWDAERQSVGLDAQFYEGQELMMFPPDWLNLAEQRAVKLKGVAGRRGLAMGVDPGEGMANTSVCVGDTRGILTLVSRKTPNTAKIKDLVFNAMHQWGVPPERTIFDAGGGGKQIADQMREDGYPVVAIAFGSSPRLPIKHGITTIDERVDVLEERASYVCFRDQIYYEARELIDPVGGEFAYAIPAEYEELRRQLEAIPLTRDRWGRVKLIPKDDPNPHADTLKKRLGCSPDEADSFVLMCHGLLRQDTASEAGAF